MKIALPLLSGGLAMLALPCLAVQLTDSISISGFGTAGMFRADDPNATVRADNRVSTGSRDELRFDQDSLLAVQGNFRPAGPFNAAIQLISKKNISSSNKPRLQWAYIGWEPTPALNLKLGRSVAPLGLMSDYRDLYYAQITARPHGSVYYNNPITYNDGLTGLWEHGIGAGNLALEGYYGKTSVKVASGEADVPKQFGLSAKWMQGGLTLRLGASSIDVDFTPTPGGQAAGLLGAIKNAQALGLCSNCNAVYQDRLQTSIGNKAYSVAAVWEGGGYTLQGEFTKRKSDSMVIGSAQGWYLLGAKRFGDFTPYLVLGKLRPDNEPIGLVATPPATPSPQQRQILGAIAIANATNVVGTYQRDQHAAGMRWDFYKNLALKFQWDYYKLKQPRWGSAGTVAYSLADAPKFDGRINAYSLNLDFIF